MTGFSSVFYRISDIIRVRGVRMMQVKTFLITMGAGIAVGAAAAIVLPKNRQVRHAVNMAADSIENAAVQAKDFVARA